MAAVGQATRLPSTTQFFKPHLFCICWAHWMAEEMFCDLGNLLETNCRARVQCNWTAGCPVEWGKSDAAPAEGMKQEFISLAQNTHSTLLAQGVHIHRQKHIRLLFLCQEILGPRWMCIFPYKPSLSNLYWWVCPMQICKWARMRTTICSYRFKIWERPVSSLRRFPLMLWSRIYDCFNKGLWV